MLEGMVRVRKMISGREDVLATLGAGEMFGEMSLFDDSKRSADIVANSDGVLLRLSLDVMQRMVDKQPEVVVPFLVEVAKKMAERIRADNERHKKDTILMVQSADNRRYNVITSPSFRNVCGRSPRAAAACACMPSRSAR